MKANRRGFLGLLGASPLAAKAAAEAEIANLTGARSGLASGMNVVTGMPAGGVIGGQQFISPYVHAMNYIKTFGKLPDFVVDDLRERTQHVYVLDPDIACKRSWSFSVKVQHQRERNLEREIKRFSYNGRKEVAQTAFQKLTGFMWPW